MDEERDDAVERQARLDREDLETLLVLPSGRRFLWTLLERTGVFGASYSPDTHAMAFTEGRRSVGLELMLRLQRETPNRWVEMLGEVMQARAEQKR